MLMVSYALMLVDWNDMGKASMYGVAVTLLTVTLLPLIGRAVFRGIWRHVLEEGLRRPF